MAAVVLYLVSLLLFQQAVLCNSMVPQHDTRKSGWNHANSISKTRVLSDSMLFKSTKESKKTSTVPVFAANDLWSLLLGMKDNSPSETESKSKSNPSGLHRLQILTKSSSFLPGLSFLKIEKEPAKNYKTVRTELQPSTFSKKSSKQTAIRKLSHERGEIAKTSPTETMGTKTIRINENEIEQVFNSLQDQTIAPTTLPPLERTTGYNALLPTTVGSLLGLNLRLMNSISKQTEAVKAEPKYETIDKIKAQEPDMHVTDQANYHPSEPVEMRSLPDVSEQQIQKPNLVVNIKPTSQMKRHIDSQHKVQTKSNSFHPHTISNSSTDFIKGDVKASKQPVKVHDLQMNHPGSSNNGEFIIRQRTVDFMDPYTLEQQWLKKANMELKSKSKESSLRLNSIEPRTTLDLFDIQSAYKHMDLKISTSTSIPLPMSVNVKSKEGQGGQGHGWQGYDGHGHIGSRVTLESHHNNNQHDQHQISLHPERKFVERKNFNIKQIPQSSNNYVEPFANKLDVHANLKKHPLSGQHAGNRGLPYNIIKSAHKFSQSLISDKNQAGSILHSRMHTSPTVRPPKDLRPYHQLSPGGINWDFSETRSTGKEQHNGRQSRQQIDGSTTERPTTDWMSPKQQLPGGNTLEHYDNRQTGHRTQVTGNRGLPYNLIKSAHEFSQSLISDKNQAGSILHSRMHTSTTVRPPKDLRPYHQLSQVASTGTFLRLVVQVKNNTTVGKVDNRSMDRPLKDQQQTGCHRNNSYQGAIRWSIIITVKQVTNNNTMASTVVNTCKKCNGM
ncbi:uncharacterized protein LOC110461845 [Mizuhopecten yessoensis]|uniref:uncharacterized protein LOC110461845 n=1 Tax=Mizuhopecten yessoensis TaxID=6573 RepID=UPI000B458FA8|nr:uncharacterized protein LOC110461845 [Mizuhopecten yessoensis]